jgi:hypothetical protein
MIKGRIFLLMILPLSLVFINNTINRHQHILIDGMIVEHAHPFHSSCSDSKPENDHKHTDRELILYTILTDSPVLASTLSCSPELFLWIDYELIIPQQEEVLIIESVSPGLLRAPPC